MIRQTASCGVSILLTDALLSNPVPSLRPILLVFAPGYACRASDFEKVIGLLSSRPGSFKQETYVSIDFPGTGETPLAGFDIPSITNFAKLLNRVKDELLATQENPECEVVLVGHSMGVRIALDAFRQDPTHVKGIIFVDGSNYMLRGKEYVEQQLRMFKEQNPSALITQEQRNAQEEVIETLFNNMFTNHTPGEFKRLAVQDGKKSIQDFVLLRRSHIQWDGEKMDSTLDLVSKQNMPILVVQATDAKGAARILLRPGEESEWMKYLKGKLEARYTGATLDGLGHFPHIDGPDRVAKAIRTWLDENIGIR